MFDTKKKKLLSSRDIADAIGCNANCALRKIKRGDFGHPVNISSGTKRIHWRVQSTDFDIWFKREFKHFSDGTLFK